MALVTDGQYTNRYTNAYTNQGHHNMLIGIGRAISLRAPPRRGILPRIVTRSAVGWDSDRLAVEEDEKQRHESNGQEPTEDKVGENIVDTVNRSMPGLSRVIIPIIKNLYGGPAASGSVH